jgi:hypothetical protein
MPDADAVGFGAAISCEGAGGACDAEVDFDCGFDSSQPASTANKMVPMPLTKDRFAEIVKSRAICDRLR